MDSEDAATEVIETITLAIPRQTLDSLITSATKVLLAHHTRGGRLDDQMRQFRSSLREIVMERAAAEFDSQFPSPAPSGGFSE